MMYDLLYGVLFLNDFLLIIHVLLFTIDYFYDIIFAICCVRFIIHEFFFLMNVYNLLCLVTALWS